MVHILICNQKGGVGKSLIADELAFSFERSKIPVAFLDLDVQGGTIHPTDQRQDAKVCVIDTPGALQKNFGLWMSEADVILIPTKTTSRDIAPLLRMQQIAVQNAPDRQVVYILNGWNRWRASADFMDWFRTQKRHQRSVILSLPQSEKFVQAGAAGKSVVEFSRHSGAAKATLNMVNHIRQLSGFPAE